MLYFIQLPLYLAVTRLSKLNFYLSKNQEFTDIDSNENINLLKNDSKLLIANCK